MFSTLEQSKWLTSRVTNFQVSTHVSSCTVQFRVLMCTGEVFCSLLSSVYEIFQISYELSFLLENLFPMNKVDGGAKYARQFPKLQQW